MLDWVDWYLKQKPFSGFAGYGGGGTGHMNYMGFGGGGYFGSGTLSCHGNWNQGTRSNQLKAPRGAGGTSGYQGSYQGANGMSGCVIVMEFV